jgi:hypothetical protein
MVKLKKKNSVMFRILGLVVGILFVGINGYTLMFGHEPAFNSILGLFIGSLFITYGTCGKDSLHIFFSKLQSNA